MSRFAHSGVLLIGVLLAGCGATLERGHEHLVYGASELVVNVVRGHRIRRSPCLFFHMKAHWSLRGL